MTIVAAGNSLQQIGNTSLVCLSGLAGADSATVWGKLEGTNPGGSVKDRIALAMIEQAEADGLLVSGATIVEPTSGNTGIGLALVCAVKGYRLILTMPDTMSAERQRLFGAYGAKLELTPGNKGMRGAIERAEELAASEGAFMPQQFKNPANPAVHQATTGPEILAALDGQIDAFVAGVGTGGTLTGVGRALRAQQSSALLVAVEPEGSQVLAGGDPGPHRIQGIGAGFVPEVLDLELVDEIVAVNDLDAIETTRRLTREAGILSGVSSGANVFAALNVARRLGPGKNVVTIICDTGERYLSTGIFD